MQRHACSVIGTRQYGRMEISCASAPPAKGSGNIEAAGKAEERETKAPNLFKAPQAAEERETNTPCRGHGDMGNQRVGGGGCRPEERRKAADQRRPRAAAGSRDGCRIPGGWGAAQPNSGGGNRHGHPTNNKPEPW